MKMEIQEGRKRVIIESVRPEIDSGRFPIKRVVGEKVIVEADIFGDSHDAISCLLLYRCESAAEWTEAAMKPTVNDHWKAEFQVSRLGRYRYTIEAFVDAFRSWRNDLSKKIEAEADTDIDYLIGAQLIGDAVRRALQSDAEKLRRRQDTLLNAHSTGSEKRQLALDQELAEIMFHYPNRQLAVQYHKQLEVIVERDRARFSSWYEFFPRSCAREPGRHGTFKDCEAQLDYVAAMGFDVIYLPPIHPIGRTHRKGKNNVAVNQPDDVGSPWAIGAEEGGHKAIHPQLGSLEDFRSFVDKAQRCGIEIALDIALQCSPDHPYVKEHPEWFRLRPDGTVQYAENPPKRYQDIFPFDFECADWRKLWEELRSIFLFWCDQGIRIFRVDNPHTKPFPFWEWVIGEVRNKHPETIFLSEAFTRPKVMHRLAKLGFSQSYTYFTWRNTKHELIQYFSELMRPEQRDFFRPNLWPNTPDILTEYLQYGGRPAFMVRLVLAATLGASYGIYGPVFELCERIAREPGSEEYLDSEKYEIRCWDWDRLDSLKNFIARVNRIRRQNRALQTDESLRFHSTDNDQILCYSKHTLDYSNVILVAVNLDPHHVQSGWVHLDAAKLGIDANFPYQVHDLLSEGRYLWQGQRNYVELDPAIVPANVFVLRRRLRTEKQFDYYM
jgi:starch synthase (maltosyl-transferring)